MIVLFVASLVCVQHYFLVLATGTLQPLVRPIAISDHDPDPHGMRALATTTNRCPAPNASLTGSRLRTAFVTLMAYTKGYSFQDLLSQIVLHVVTLRSHGITNCIVMYTPEVPSFGVKIVERLGCQMRLAEQINLNTTIVRWVSGGTKMHMWSWMDYDLLAFYDADVVFLNSPAGIFAECLDSVFCAPYEYTGFNGRDTNGEINGGCFVIKPSMSTYLHIMENFGKGQNIPADQYIVNHVYRRMKDENLERVRILPQAYNVMLFLEGSPGRRMLDNTTQCIIAVHSKFPELRSTYPQKHWVWNRLDEITVQTDLSFLFRL